MGLTALIILSWREKKRDKLKISHPIAWVNSMAAGYIIVYGCITVYG